jgi:hypothetical protein
MILIGKLDRNELIFPSGSFLRVQKHAALAAEPARDGLLGEIYLGVAEILHNFPVSFLP